MDTETWLHGRLSSKSKGYEHRVGSLARSNDRMQPSCFDSDLEGSNVGSLDSSSLPSSAALRPYIPKGIFSPRSLIRILLIAFIAIIKPSIAASVNFQNCMSPDIINSDPRLLQFRPLYVNATFSSSGASHVLKVTVYGDVSGSTPQKILPPQGDQHWGNPNEYDGKISDVTPSSNNVATTLKATFNVLDYKAYASPLMQFCNYTVQRQCPLGPSFTNGSDPAKLPAFYVAHDLYSPYAFTTIIAVLKVTSGEASAAPLACIEASITPDLGTMIGNVLTYLPLVILILVAVATAYAAIFSPWGSMDVFRWTSNYGRDADLLRLVTPGFGDCLQYIQFIILAGSLSLDYPGFYQPVVSQVSWSALMFNESFVTHGQGTQSLVDGVYEVANGTYGLNRMSQLVGMTADKDLWAGMVVWLLVILAAFVVLIQVGFVCRWSYRHISRTQEEDLRAKNIPFTVGNSIRIVFNYFLLPIVSLSTYQMVIAGRSPSATVGLAALLLLACAGFAARLLWLVASTRPRSYLFDDLPTVLLYGPLYNTYSDNAATFALVPMMLTFIRGIAIGAVQPSGIAQLVLLAICEVILILTLNAFRPFHSPTSMNAFHTFFAVARLVTILLSVAFVPSLSVKAGPRGWIGYIILFMHAIVLVFGFFLNACQTLIEVIARVAGAGGEEGVGGGVARGGLVKVFGMRQLSRRNPRRRGQARHSMASDANILGHESDKKSFQLNGGRSRSMSGSSAILLNRPPGTDTRRSMGLDSVSTVSAVGGRHHNAESGSAPYTPVISGGASAFSYLPGGSQAAGQGGSGLGTLKAADPPDPWYRPPRARRPTNDTLPPSNRNKASWVGAEWANRRWSQQNADGKDGSPIPIEFQADSGSGRATPLAAHIGSPRDRADSNADDPRRSKTDYAIREVDFYYGVRGPALSTLPTRRLKTGPADPTGPVSSATGWFKGFLGGKTKDKGKGFEVVRSSKAPPTDRRASPRTNHGDATIPYSDESPPTRVRDLELSDDGDAIGGGTRHFPDETGHSTPTSEDDDAAGSLYDEEYDSINRVSQLSQFPPSLPTIETGGGIELPSRITSKASSRPTRHASRRSETPIQLHRRHSKRMSLRDEFNGDDGLGLSKAAPLPASSPQSSPRHDDPNNISQDQPSGIISNRLPFESRVSSSQDRPSTGIESATSSILPPNSNDRDTAKHLTQPPSALGSHAPDLRQDRPSSMGYVQQHRASENIHTANPEEPALVGSSAEVVDDSSRRNTLSDRRN